MAALRKLMLALAPLAIILLQGCHDIEPYDNTRTGNFEQLWRILDEHYCFFDEKGVDWDDVYVRYSKRVSNSMSSADLFDLCAEMLDELKDGHTNLSSSFNVSYYRGWWSDYPQDFDERLVEQYYLSFNYLTSCGITYGILPQNVAYMRYSSFSYTIGEGNLDEILAYFVTAAGLIIDLRDNSGGNLTNVETLVARFITEPTLVGYICHKTGSGHTDFSEPYAITYNPAAQGRIRWGKPVVILTNRSTYSAANNFVSIMKLLPNVRIAGATTGGGSGMPINYELSNGWGVRFSACPIYDAQGRLTEFGVEPTEGCEVSLDPEAALMGRDSMLDFAVTLLTGG